VQTVVTRGTGGAGGGQVNIITRQGGSEFHERGTNSFGQRTRRAHLERDPAPAISCRITTWLDRRPALRKADVLFRQLRGLPSDEAKTAMDTVPTERNRWRFQRGGATIFDPSASYANPNYKPGSAGDHRQSSDAAQPRSRTTPFRVTVVPGGRPDAQELHAASQHGGRYGYGMTMNGTPAVFGAGMDSNNLLDVRDATERNNQGTIRVDRMFGNSARSTCASRRATNRDHAAEPAGLRLQLRQRLPERSRHLDAHPLANLVNTASAGVSRLAMFHWSQNNFVNDIVDALGITGTNFGGPAAWGARIFNVQGTLRSATPGRPRRCTNGARPSRAGKRLWAKGRHSFKLGEPTGR